MVYFACYTANVPGTFNATYQVKAIAIEILKANSLPEFVDSLSPVHLHDVFFLKNKHKELIILTAHFYGPQFLTVWL